MSTSLKKILLIACGGTISCRLDKSGGVIPKLTGDDIIAEVSGLKDIAEITTVQFRQVSSCELRLTDLIELNELLADDYYDGFIITQGTDSLEETAFALDLLYQGDNPVIVTGAMRHPSLHSSDGAGNVMASTIVASSEKAKNLGVIVVMNDTVHAARFVRKTHTSRLEAFQSRPYGEIGYICENRFIKNINLNVQEKIEISDDLMSGVQTNRVAIITAISGDDGEILRVIREHDHYKGVVIDALGGGHVSKALANQIALSEDKLIIAITSSTDGGSTLFKTYASHGNELDLIEKKAIMAGQLNAKQARIYLQLLLALKLPREKIVERFNKINAIDSS